MMKIRRTGLFAFSENFEDRDEDLEEDQYETEEMGVIMDM